MSVMSADGKGVQHAGERESDPPARANRFGQHHSGSVDRLEDTLQVYPSGDFSDQNRSHSFGAKLLVHAEEVDLNHFLFSEQCTQRFAVSVWAKYEMQSSKQSLNMRDYI